MKRKKTITKRPKVVVVMPAYNAEKTLKLTYGDLPKDIVDSIILVDDASRDKTVAVAKKSNLKVFMHRANYGYGANQKTCYTEALKDGGEIIVMVHPDYQYDPKLLPKIIEPILKGKADVVLGSRFLINRARAGGMPWWKYVANRFLTWCENQVFGLNLAEYHTGYRAYKRQVLEEIPFILNSDGFIFDQEFIAQAVVADFKIKEVAVPTKYFPEASSASFWQSSRYGLGILWLLLKFYLHKKDIRHSKQLTLFSRRYFSGQEK